MKKEKSTQTIIIAVLAVAILVMSVGFATYTQTLNINGTATVKKSEWKVQYDTEKGITPLTGSVTANPSTLTATDWTFTVTLNEPGDFYEATADAKNYGTIDAVLKKLTMTALTAEQAKYLKYSVYYDGTEYTATNNNLNLPLAAEASKPVKVRVEYLQPESSSDLPSQDQTITLTASLYYEDANSQSTQSS